MEHLLLKAAVTTATDQGAFEAVISTATPDREGDVVEPQAMVDALAKWAALGKLMPLAYAHVDPASGHIEVVGHVDPASARTENSEVIVKGQVDRSTARGQETWRLVKSGTVSFSFGYLIPDGGATKRKGGRLNIHAIDLYEVSVVPVGPANNDTRVLSWKALARDVVTEEHIQAALDGDTDNLPQDVKDQLSAVAQRILDNTKQADVTDPELTAPSVDPLRKRTQDIALEVLSDGVRPPTKATPEPKPQPELDPAVLRRLTRDLMVHVLSE